MSTKMMDKQVNTMSNKMVDSESDASEILHSTTNLTTGELTKFQLFFTLIQFQNS